MSVGGGKEGRCGDVPAYRNGEQLAGYRNWCAGCDTPDNAQRRTRGLRQEFASSIAWSVMHWE